MALPPWTVELLRRGVQDLARQVTDPETAAALKEQATKLVDELPKAARAKVDTFLKQADASTKPIRDAWNQGELWRNAERGTVGQGGKPNRIINGSGCLLNPAGSGVALPRDVLDAAAGFLVGDGANYEGIDSELGRQIAEVIQTHVGSGSESWSAVITTSLDAAIACIPLLSGRGDGSHPNAYRSQGGGGVWVPRCCAVPLNHHDWNLVGEESGSKELFLVDRLRQLGTRVREFGSAQGATSLPATHSRGSHADDNAGPPRSTLVRLPSILSEAIFSESNRAEWNDVVILPTGQIFSEPEVLSGIDSVAAQLQSGADLVILGGGVLSGIPSVGVLVGKASLIQRILDSPKSRGWIAPTAFTAMVAASVRGQAAGSSPLGELAKVSEENLRDRAERLATQLGDQPWVESVRVTNDAAIISPDPKNEWMRLPSRQVVLQIDPAHDSAAIAKRLATAPTGLLTRLVDDTVVIDLRWITPEQQSQLNELAAHAGGQASS